MAVRIPIKDVKIPVLFRSLLNRDVTGVKIPAFVPSATDTCLAAVYQGNDGVNLAVCVCDLELVTYAGAALVLLQPPVAKEAIATRKLDPSLTENFQEILNICATLLTGPDVPHVKLGPAYVNRAEWPEEVNKFIAPARSSVAVKITIAGYGAGRMGIFT
jgi:hypothetical protein